LVVYTAITGGYDKLAPVRYKDCDFICFTDSDIKVSGWQIRPLPYHMDDPARCNRKIKILPHRILQEYEYSIYIDGNIELINNPVKLIKGINFSTPLIVYRNHQTKSLADEVDACIRLGKDDPDILNKQKKRYLEAGLPSENNMITGNVLIRKHNDPRLIPVMEDWWREVKLYSKRDQVSFNYVVWKNDFTCAYMNSPLVIPRGSKFFFVRYPHKNQGKETLFSSVKNEIIKIILKFKKKERPHITQ